MSWYEDQPQTPIEPTYQPAPTNGLVTRTRRGILTATMAGLLLVGGGAAVVMAATPDPSATPTPSTQGDGSGSDSQSDTQSDTQSGTKRDCPNKDGNGGTDAPSDSGASSTSV